MLHQITFYNCKRPFALSSVTAHTGPRLVLRNRLQST